MRTDLSLRALAIALTLAIGFAPNASAQGADTGPGQRPPAEQQTPAEPRSPEELNKCASMAGDYKKAGNAATFVVTLTNSCDKRLRCAIHAYVIGAYGPARGKGTVILAPKSKGADAQKSYVMKVKQLSGSAYVAWDCKAI